MSESQQQYDKAAELEKSSPEQALAVYNALVHNEGSKDRFRTCLYRAQIFRSCR
jgi:hypothetical protein